MKNLVSLKLCPTTRILRDGQTSFFSALPQAEKAQVLEAISNGRISVFPSKGTIKVRKELV